MSVPPVLEQIGRYDVERLLARGGMAEVYVGKALGPGGFSKSVVIKRILPDLAEDPAFIEMFLSEAKLAALLNHPNVVQVFDFGQHAGHYFLAMEFVEGQTVRALMRSFQKTKQTMPAPFAVRIAAGVCDGLHYAHQLCDEDGNPYGVVHRDIAPDNVIVSSSGVPKVVDFGIAKAVSNVHRSEVGTVKGKYAYMAPELILSEPTDRQLDVYALGVMLFEVVVGRRPYEGATELALMHAILKGDAPSAALANPTVPQTLADIISVAMHCDKKQRYATARELKLALEEWLVHAGHHADATDLADMVLRVTQESGGPSKTALHVVAPSSGVRHLPGSVSTPGLVRPGATPTGSFAPILPIEDPSTARLPFVEAELVTERPRSRPLVWVGVALALGVLTAGVVLARRGASETPGPPPQVEVEPATPAVALVPVEPPPEVQPPPESPEPEPPPLRPVAVVVGSVKKPKVSNESAKDGEDGFLTLRTEPWGDVFLGAEKLGTTPLIRLAIPSGKRTLLLRNEKMGLSRKLVLTVKPGEETKQALVVPVGTLIIEAAAGTEVALDGTRLGVAPLGPLEIVEGKHQVRLGAVVRVVKLRGGKTERVSP